MSRKKVLRIIRVSAILLFIVCGVSRAGTFTDSRDGQTYKTVTIGTQTWMTENFNYETDDSWCYENNAANCQKYGRLYTWKSAMTACPDGWHLPGDNEYLTLYNYVDANNGDEDVVTSLKSTSGWNNENNGTDRFSFSAIPAGNRINDFFTDAGSNFFSVGYTANFWSATENHSGYAYNWYLAYYSVDFSLNSDNELEGFSVRCLKD